MYLTLLFLIIFFSGLFFASKRLLLLLRYLQQEEYDSQRFLAWFWRYKFFDRKASLALLLLLPFSNVFLSSIVLCLFGFYEVDPRKTGKIKLNMTLRAEKIYKSAVCFSGFFSAFSFFLLLQTSSWLVLIGQLFFIQTLPFLLVLVNQLLKPKEMALQQFYIKEAKELLKKINPYVVGITGSYGKTSSKDIVSHLLNGAIAPTFWPVKGVNTEMGITREIRSRLKKGHRFAVIEMGAYKIGSIQKLCNLTPPHAGLITIVGSAHLERFGSHENIRWAKSELAQAIPQEGILVCNGDCPGARWIAEKFPKKTSLLYGFDNAKGDLTAWIRSFKVMPEGTYFDLAFKNREYHGFVPLFGKAALSNVVGAFTLADALGGNPEYLLAILRNLEPVDNRLQVKKEGQITYIHDAYNSNPKGFLAALEVAEALPAKRKIIMTPGMIELAEDQAAENERAGEHAGRVCDMAILVGDTNKNALSSGLKKGGMVPENLFFCSTRTEAFALLKKISQEGDLILIENDLSDIYEGIPRL